jgi:hypothetical protein
MKQKIVSNVFLLAGFMALTACPAKNDSNQNNVVTPQGRISALSSPGTFCDINSGTISCSSIDQTTGQSCLTNAKNYNPADLTNFCQQVAQLRIESRQGSFNTRPCNVDAALAQVLTQSCGGPNNPNGNLPQDPNNPGNGKGNGQWGQQDVKNFQCEFEAQRTRGGFLGGSAHIPKTIAQIQLVGNVSQTIDLRSRFLGIDLSKFGKISMRYAPLGSTPGRSADTIILQLQDAKIGVNRAEMSRSGFAGQEVRLEAQDPNVFISIACRGTSQFRASQATGSNLACSGGTRSAGDGRRLITLPGGAQVSQEIDRVISQSELSGGQEVQLTSTLSVKLENGNKLTYTGVLDEEQGPTIIATSSLKAPAELRAAETKDEKLGFITVQCKLQ